MSVAARPSHVWMRASILLLWMAASCSPNTDAVPVTVPPDPLRDGSAHDVLFPGPGHIVIAEWFGGASVSRDAGKSWKRSSCGMPVGALTLGLKGRIWGLYGWPGIHEPASGAVCFSDDGGDRWQEVWFKPVRFVPLAFVSKRGEEPIILARDGVLWRHESEATESMNAWSTLGTSNPDREGTSGVKVGSAYYVTSGEGVWMSRDGGTSWTGKDLPGSRIGGDDEAVWVVTRGGDVYQGAPGALDFVLKARLPDIDLVLGVTAAPGRCLVAAQGRGWTSAGYSVDRSGKFRAMKGIQDHQCYSVRTDRDGIAWFVARGLFREGLDGSCDQLWPPKGDPR